MNSDLESLRELEKTILVLTRLMVDDPAAVRLELAMKPEETLMRLHVAPEDVGKVIGKQGRTARALRTILGGIGVKHGHTISLDIVSPRDALTSDLNLTFAVHVDS